MLIIQEINRCVIKYLTRVSYPQRYTITKEENLLDKIYTVYVN